MLRLIYVILARVFSIIHYVPKMAYYAKHSEKYTEEDRYDLARIVVGKVKKTSRIDIEYFGLENLPENGGYIMYANHQGKFDGPGIIYGHKRPCSVLMDEKRSKVFIAKQFVDLLGGQRINPLRPRTVITALDAIAAEVSEGRVYLIFPEGGYRKHQDNMTNTFKNGCFKSAIKAKCPIIPVALIDFYQPFGENSLKRVKATAVFLPAISYCEYADKPLAEIASMIKDLIDAEIKRRMAMNEKDSIFK